MGAIAGWVAGGRTEARPPSALLEILRSDAACPAVGDVSGSHLAVHEQCALALVAARQDSWHSAENGLSCAVVGRPRWRSPDLARMDDECGAASTFAHVFAREGSSCLRHLAGRFALVLTDSSTSRAFLAVDHIARHPIYLTRTANGAFVFATSADSLRRYPGVESALSAQMLYEYFYFQCVLSKRSVYHGIYKLPPSWCASIEGARVSLGEYWHLPVERAEKFRASARELRHELLGALRRSVAHTMSKTELSEIGSFLSGGVDTSSILAVASEQHGPQRPSFTARFDVQGFDESPYALTAARRFQSDQEVITMRPKDMAESLPVIARAFDEPFANSSAAGVLVLARAARQKGLRVLMSGDRGDELFLGSPVYVLMRRFELFGKLPSEVQSLIEQVTSRFPGAASVRLVSRMKSYVWRAKQPMPARLRTYDFLSPGTAREVFTPEFLALVDTEGSFDTMRRIYDESGADDLADRLRHYLIHVVSADNDIRKVSRMCDVSGIEARFPIFDDDMLEFSAHVPSRLLLRGNRERAIFRDAVRGFIPEETVDRPKHCFTHPLGSWLLGVNPLRRAVDGALDRFAQRGIVRPDFIAGMREKWRSSNVAVHFDLAWYMAVLDSWLSGRRLATWS